MNVLIVTLSQELCLMCMNINANSVPKPNEQPNRHLF